MKNKTRHSILFSIIIPVYNKRPHISRSIKSVLNQTYKNYEIILINDNSTDGSLEEIEKYKDKRIKVYHRKTRGPGGYAGRNLGIEKAEGNWIAFLDADDEWSMDYLQQIKDGIVNHPSVKMISCSWLISYGNKSKMNPYHTENSNKGEHYYDVWSYLQSQSPTWTGTVVIQADVLKISKGFDISYRHEADQELWLRLLYEQKIKALYIPYKGAIYHKDSINTVTSSMDQEKSPRVERIKKILDRDKDILSKKEKIILKRHSNRVAKKVMLRKLLKDGCDRNYLSSNLYFKELEIKYFVFFSLLHLIPKKYQKTIYYQLFKKLF